MVKKMQREYGNILLASYNWVLQLKGADNFFKNVIGIVRGRQRKKIDIYRFLMEKAHGFTNNIQKNERNKTNF